MDKASQIVFYGNHKIENCNVEMSAKLKSEIKLVHQMASVPLDWEQEISAPIIKIIEVVNWIALCQCWSIKLDIWNYVAVNLSLKGAFAGVIGVNINAPK